MEHKGWDEVTKSVKEREEKSGVPQEWQAALCTPFRQAFRTFIRTTDVGVQIYYNYKNPHIPKPLGTGSSGTRVQYGMDVHLCEGIPIEAHTSTGKRWRCTAQETQKVR